MLKSLRWRLQIWHALILTCVIAGFGAALYLQIRRATLGDIDEELLSGARVLEASLAMPPPPGFRPRPPRDSQDRGRPRESDLFAQDFDFPPQQGVAPERERERDRMSGPGPGPGGPGYGGRGFGGPGGPGPGGQGFGPGRREPDLSLPESMRFPRRPGEPVAYFAVFGVRGERLAGNFDEVPFPPALPSGDYAFRNVGPRREVVLRGPSRRLILVGRDVSPVLDGLQRLMLPIVLSGVGVLSIGLIGGWWLAGRAIEPLQRISATAEKVTAQSLGSRIDVNEMDAELEQLGSILNSMLSRLEGSFEQQTRFVADASHELRTPISVLSMHCELALSKTRTPEEYSQTLTTCLRASNRMKSLVEDLLTLARADAGQLVVRQEPLDLSLIVDESIQLLNPLAQQQGLTITCHATTCPIVGDSNHLLRLTNNLISNAILYNKPEGAITVTVGIEDEVAVLTVEDTGVGMHEADVKRAFERFYRIDEARSRDNGGSGLGLSICKSIVEAHQGRISITSAFGVGTKVEVRLGSVRKGG
jgi:two-component system, OmpR family, sensor kinase